MSALHALAAHVGPLHHLREVPSAAHALVRRGPFAQQPGFGFGSQPRGARPSGRGRASASLVDAVASQVGAGSPLASPAGKKHPPTTTRRRLLKRDKRSIRRPARSARSRATGAKERRSIFDDTDDHFEPDDDYTGILELNYQEDFDAQPTRTTSPTIHKRSATPSRTSWVNGATGTVYAKLNNGTRTMLTDASNIFVVENGGDTSNGGPLQIRIQTDAGASASAPFWLINETGDFCTNSDATACYVSLAKGLNDAPWSLVPVEVSDGEKRPPAVWTVDPQTGVLSATWKGQGPLIFTQNENEFGNGDIDAWNPDDALGSMYSEVALTLLD